MYQKSIFCFVVWALGGSSLFYQGWNFFDPSVTTGNTAVELKTESALACELGKSTIEILIEVAAKLRKMIWSSYESFKLKFMPKGKAETPPSTASAAENPAPTPRPFEASTLPKQSETDPLSNLQADLKRGWNDIVASTTKLKDDNEILGLIWSVITEGDYLVFIAGVVLPVLLPSFWPAMGHLFWCLVGLAQLALGFRYSKLHRHLGWVKEEETSEEEEEEERAVEASEPAPAIASTPPKDETNPSENSSSPGFHAAAPAKSFPAFDSQQQQQPEAIWRNCSSDTKCRQEAGKVENRRNITRREKLGLPPFSVHDIRRVAPPIDATASVRKVIEEVERRRQEKADAARLLDEEHDLLYFDYDGQNDDQVRLPTVDDDRNNLRYGFDEVGGDAAANQPTTKAENTAEWLQTGKNDVEKKEDGDATAYVTSNVDWRRENVKNRIGEVKAELQALSALVESRTEAADHGLIQDPEVSIVSSEV